MKTLFSVLAAAAVLGFAAPTSAKADYPGETRIVGYNPNGTPIIAVYQPATIDAYGRPIYQWITPGLANGYTGGYSGGYSAPRPVYVQPPRVNLGVGIGVGGAGCRPNYGYGYSHHHHHGFYR
ncbi:hypothetical protein [Prosthecobacter sp.]|uniref:hypothetical protein n=1 Tax=Prosthecobacter sp. TaxID=1965333 RepID=UPI003782FEEE